MGTDSFVSELASPPLVRTLLKLYLSFIFPYRNAECRRLASSSKDTTVRIWDVVLGNTVLTLSGHTMSVTCVKWGGKGLIYTSSQDRTIKVWRASDVSIFK